MNAVKLVLVFVVGLAGGAVTMLAVTSLVVAPGCVGALR